ncbi:MAG: zf-HC2 domain-containing protein [Phycisphaerae bacterium]
MEQHLELTNLADWLAARALEDRANAETQSHMNHCDTCRATADRADALLDAAATLIAEGPADRNDCPDPTPLAAYVDGSLPAVERMRIDNHVRSCADCAAVVKAVCEPSIADESETALNGRGMAGRTRLGLWMSGAAILTMAAVITVLFVIPEQAPLELNLTVYQADAVRSSPLAAVDADDREFEITVKVAEPMWVHLLVIDSAGDLLFLEEKQVKERAVFGRYGVRPPDRRDDPNAQRRFALLLQSKASLLDRLGEFEHLPVRLSEDPHEAAARVESIMSRLETQFHCLGRIAPISNPVDMAD